jgi:hypothetical protein
MKIRQNLIINTLEEKMKNMRMRLYGNALRMNEERISEEVWNVRKGNTEEEEQDEDWKKQVNMLYTTWKEDNGMKIRSRIFGTAEGD